MPSDAILYEYSVNGLSNKDIAKRFNLNKDSVRSRISRYNRKMAKDVKSVKSAYAELQERVVYLENLLEQKARDDEPMAAVGKPWRLEGDFIVAGDVHCDTVNKGFMQRPLQIASAYLDHPRRLLLAGDFLNADAFSTYPAIAPGSSFARELSSARAFFDTYLNVFDEIYWILGNHDRRVQKASKLAIEPEDLLRMISGDPRIKVSWWGHAVVETKRGEWRISHGSEYSINQLVVADQFAQKYRQNIILHHQHHCAVGWSRFKDFVVVDNGGLFDETMMAYVNLDDSKKPRMTGGFTMLKDGTPYLFGREPMTDYNFWLRGKAA